MQKCHADGRRPEVRQMYKSFIIGCGRIAGYSDNNDVNDFTHGYAYQENPDIQLAGCMDLHSKKGQLFAKKFNCTSFDNFQDGITSTGSEIVSICTTDNTHYAVAKSILEMDSNMRVIFLEKPACSSMAEMEELIALSDAKKIDIVINHTRKFDKRYQKIKEHISEGIYGDFINGVVTYYSGWEHNGVHVIDALSFLFDEDITIKNLKKISDSPYPNDPTLNGELLLSNSKSEIQLLSFDESYYQLFEFDLRFEKVRLRIENFGTRILLEKKKMNNIGENVLVMHNNSFVNNNETPIQTAIDLIIDRLVKNNRDILCGYRLQDVAGIMKTIWKGLELYEN